MKNHTITFEGNTIDVALLLKHAGPAPVIEIDVSELAEGFETMVSNAGLPDCGTVLLYKVNGRYVALQGVWVIQELRAKGNTKITGKLVSKQLMKKIHTVAVPLQVHNRMAERAMGEGRQEYRPNDGFGTIGERMNNDRGRNSGERMVEYRPRHA